MARLVCRVTVFFDSLLRLSSLSLCFFRFGRLQENNKIAFESGTVVLAKNVFFLCSCRPTGNRSLWACRDYVRDNLQFSFCQMVYANVTSSIIRFVPFFFSISFLRFIRLPLGSACLSTQSTTSKTSTSGSLLNDCICWPHFLLFGDDDVDISLSNRINFQLDCNQSRPTIQLSQIKSFFFFFFVRFIARDLFFGLLSSLYALLGRATLNANYYLRCRVRMQIRADDFSNKRKTICSAFGLHFRFLSNIDINY